jgi:hypothetical protein
MSAVVVTCRTEGCANAGAPILMDRTTDLDGNPSPASFACGVCGQPITDVTEGGDADQPDNSLPEPEQP